jgi:Dual specificity phosphatase, catalytic domain
MSADRVPSMIHILIRSIVHPQHGFHPAIEGEQIVFGARRPGFPLPRVSRDLVDTWLMFMQGHAIQRVVCLLPLAQLACYPDDLLAIYRTCFGERQVCWAPINDFHLADPYLLTNRTLPFLLRADRDQARVVVHCGGGIGRTGHVLAAWLVAKYGLSNAQAIEAVGRSGRNARESRDPGLDHLLDTCRQLFVRSEGHPAHHRSA